MISFTHISLAMTALALQVAAIPNKLSADAALGCTGETFAHVYGYEDGCFKGYQKFSYEMSAIGCNQRCANTDNRVHYLTTDSSGNKDVVARYYVGRDCSGATVGSQVLSQNQCFNINTGTSVGSIEIRR